MKNIVYNLLVVLIFTGASAQVGIGTNTPDPSAILEIEATNAGFLPPRVALSSSTDVMTISAPAEGLMVYNTTNNGCDLTNGIYIYNGLKWVHSSESSSNTLQTRIIRDNLASTSFVYYTASSGGYGTFPALFNNIEEPNGGDSFHAIKNGPTTNDWGFGASLSKQFIITSVNLEGRTGWASRMNDIVVRLYRCGTQVYQSMPVSGATEGLNIVSIPDISADEIRLLVLNGANGGANDNVINFSELYVEGYE